MPGRRMLWHQLIGSALILLLTAGCFQAVGTDFSATDAAQAQPTWTIPPTNTPEPTDPPLATNTPEPTQSEIVLDLAVPTTDPFALLTPSDALSGVPIAQEPTIDPILLTVTAIYADGAAQLQAFTTPTPVVQQPEQPLDGIAMTATYIVEQATQVIGATLTQQAINAGAVPIVPTADPNVVVATQPASVSIVPGADCIHEVRATDRNLFRIAQNYGLTVEEIARASGIVNADLIFVGQQLTIPGCGVTGAVPLPTSTPTGGAGNTAQNVNITPPPGVTFTPIPAGDTVTSVGRTHTVRQGETLFEISLRYGTTVHSIAAVNGLANINMIYIGQNLTIP
jgi:LysM repeat protein